MSKEESMLDKWGRILDDFEKTKEFLDWLSSNNIWFCELQSGDGVDRWIPSMRKHDDLLNDYFGIDPNQLDKERKELLESFRKQ